MFWYWVYFPVPLHLCFRLKRAARQQLWISRRETSLSTSMRFPWVATDKRQSAWWKAPTRPSASWWKGRTSILCICCRHKCITLPSKWVAMAAFPTHEVDWSGAGRLFRLHWTDSQSLGYLSGLCGWMVPVDGLHLVKFMISCDRTDLLYWPLFLDSATVLAACSQGQRCRTECQVSWWTPTITALIVSSVFLSES